MKGYKHTPESIEKIRLSKLGKKRAPFSEEWKANIKKHLYGNKSRTGQKRSPEELKKLSDSIKGEKHPLWGKHHSEESRKKMSESHKGKPSPLKGKKFTEEHVKNMVESRKKNGSYVVWNKGKKYPRMAGEKNPNWKGGITPENILIRSSLEYKLWREAVFKRDNFTCQDCKDDTGGNLEAHHIKPFSLFPELRTSIDNGITLCKKCHKQTDTYAGKVLNYKTSIN